LLAKLEGISAGGYAEGMIDPRSGGLPAGAKAGHQTGRSARAAAKSTRWPISAASAVSPRRRRQSTLQHLFGDRQQLHARHVVKVSRLRHPFHSLTEQRLFGRCRRHVAQCGMGDALEGCVLLVGLDTWHGDLALAPRLSGAWHPKT
jgi:hypothetical protein